MDKSAVIDWLLEQSQKAYEAECDFTARLRDRIGLIVGLLITPIGGAIVSLLTTFKGDLLQRYNFLFFTLPLLIALAIFFFALWKICGALQKSTAYKAPHTPKQLYDYYNGGVDGTESFIDTKHIMAKSLWEAVEHNIPINFKRLETLIECQRMAIYVVPFLIICSVKYFHTSYTQEISITNVKVVNATDFHASQGEQHVQQFQFLNTATCPKSELSRAFPLTINQTTLAP